MRKWEVAQAVVSSATQVTTRARRSEAQARTPNNRGCQNGTDLRDVVRLRVRLVRPLLGAAVHAELAPGAESIRLTLTLRRAGATIRSVTRETAPLPVRAARERGSRERQAEYGRAVFPRRKGKLRRRSHKARRPP